MKPASFLFLICVLCLMRSSGIVSAQQQGDTVITLRHGEIHLPENAVQWLSEFQSHLPVEPVQVLVKFRQMPAAEERAHLWQAGLWIADFMGGTVFTAMAMPEFRQGGIDTGNITAILPVDAAWKTDPLLKTAGSLRTRVVAGWYEHTPPAALEQHIRACGGTIAGREMWHLNAAVIEIPANRITMLADWYGIRYISPAAVDTALNIESGNSAQVNMATIPAALGGRGLDGVGVTVGVGDNYSGLAHVDLNDRIVNFTPWAYHNHGVHINGIVGGAGIMDPKGKGMAPGVRLIDHLFTQVWLQTAAMKEGYNMTLTNNSYSARVSNCSYAGIYDIYSAALDDLSRLEPEVLHVFAAGNDGRNTCGNYPPGYATVVGAYQASKNVLVVANNTKWYQNAEESSRGPMSDGRIKPEISAVGTEVYSTIRDDGYLSAGGTSMASPAVTGALALLTQRYKQLHGSTNNPRADVLKTLILNGATDMGNPGPDYAFGFGVMNLSRSLEILENNRYAVQAITHGAQQTIQVSVPPHTAELKLMLYWHDTSASPAAAATLVNDLDLEVMTPAGRRHLPFVLNSAPRLVELPAMPGFDRVNNVEQVVIRDPEPGTYLVRVSGYHVPFGPQDYVVAWDAVPEGVSITFPAAGASWPAEDSLRVYWEAAPHANGFMLEFSADNGGTWTMIDNNIPSEQRYYTWYTPAINAHECRLRLTRKDAGQQHVSAPFAIHRLPVLRLDATQCPGYMAVHWDPVPNAAAYQVLQKKGSDMQAVDTVTGTTYMLRGLSVDSTYYVAIRPLIQGVPGWRSVAVKRRPDDGDCMGGISDGDLMAERIISPVSGRALTATAPGPNEPLTLMIRNLDDVAVQDFEILYRINNDPWQSQVFQQTLPANAAVPVFVTGLPLADTGTYTITAVIKNLTDTDPVAVNDSLYKVVRHHPNLPVNVDVGYTEDFEAEGREVMMPAMGVTRDERWDFTASTDTGRLRFFASPQITIKGTRSASLDARTNMNGNRNYLEGTFNLAGYIAAQHEVRLEFDYRLHGLPKFPGGNQVWVRGSDAASWISIYYYDTTADPGTMMNSGSLSLTDLLQQQGQDFTTACQIRFGQHDTGVIAAADFGNGLTLDDIRLYTVQNDVELVRIIAPAETGCNLGTGERLRVLVYNRDQQAQHNISLFYRLDSGAVHSAVLPDIDPKDSLEFLFPQLVDLSSYGVHTIDVWLSAPGDTYQANDSLMGQIFRHQPFIDSFPYLERFEASDGYWYADGKNSSWEYGTPAAVYISKAASGIGAWKTSLDGNYNNMEYSFLYSPCFDLSGLSEPMLSFSLALDIEQCDDEPCDAAWVEYSVEGGDWQKLGVAETGTNWYNTKDDVWSVPAFTRWHVASARLPRAGYLRLRFVLKTDPGVTMEGIAVDDVHIFDRVHTVYTGGETGMITVDASRDRWNDVLKDDQWIMQFHTGAQAAGGTTVQVYQHEHLYDERSAQYFFPKNFVVANRETYPDSIDMRLFVSEQDFVSLIDDSSCVHCSRPADVYSLGVSQYSDPDPARENGSLDDNITGDWTYYAARDVVWVPYDNGYYAALKIHRFSELWLNDGGPSGIFPLTFPAVDFKADKINEYQAKLSWISYVDTLVVKYGLERSYDSVLFVTISEEPAVRVPEGVYNYIDIPAVQDWMPVYYRIRYQLDDGSVYYTTTRRINWTAPDFLAEIYPNPSRNGHFAIIWSSMPEGEMFVSVTDITGRSLYLDRFAAESWNNTTMIRLNGLAKGIYMVKAIIGKHRFERKLVVY